MQRVAGIRVLGVVACAIRSSVSAFGIEFSLDKHSHAWQAMQTPIELDQLGSIINHWHRKTLNAVFIQGDFTRLFSDANSNTLQWCSRFDDFILKYLHILGLPRDIDRNSTRITTVDHTIVHHDISVRPKIFSTLVVAKQDTYLSTIYHLIVSHDIVSIAMAD